MQTDVRAASTVDSDFDHTFNRALIVLVVPIALQNLISAVAIPVHFLPISSFGVFV